MDIKKANIFKYATKELSQDAFLLWLIQWADKDYIYDLELHKIALKFVHYLIERGNPDYNDTIEKVVVYKQWERIDVSFTVNDDIFVIIEDKKDSITHDGQLKSYKDKAQMWCNANNYKLICIYIKSGNESVLSCKKNVQGDGYYIVTRSEILKVISNCQTSNNIFLDYIEYLQDLENETTSFLTLPPSKWNNRSWQGFYMELEKKMNHDDCDWGYVSNPKGGFWGIWWCWFTCSDCSLYLQIEQGNLCIKINVSENYSDIRNKWHNILIENAHKLGYLEIDKPRRFGIGNFMTIGVIKTIDYLGEGIINVDDVISRLKKYEKLIERCSMF